MPSYVEALRLLGLFGEGLIKRIKEKEKFNKNLKHTLEEAAMQELNSSDAIIVEGNLVYQRQAMLNMFRKGAEWEKEQAIEILSSVLENWVHGGDADCIIAEFEEKLNNK